MSECPKRFLRNLSKKTGIEWTNETELKKHWSGYSSVKRLLAKYPNITPPEPYSRYDACEDLPDIPYTVLPYRCLCGTPFLNKTYIEHNATGQIICVGSECIKKIDPTIYHKRCVGCNIEYGSGSYNHCNICRSRPCNRCRNHMYDNYGSVCDRCSMSKCQCGKQSWNYRNKSCIEQHQCERCNSRLDNCAVTVCNECLTSKCRCGKQLNSRLFTHCDDCLVRCKKCDELSAIMEYHIYCHNCHLKSGGSYLITTNKYKSGIEFYKLFQTEMGYILFILNKIEKPNKTRLETDIYMSIMYYTGDNKDILDNYVFPSGKYKDKSLEYVYEHELGYLKRLAKREGRMEKEIAYGTFMSLWYINYQKTGDICYHHDI